MSASKGKLYNHPITNIFSSLTESKIKSGDIGMEIELEGEYVFSRTLKWWRATEDGSLRPHGGHPPVEYVLREPVTRAELGTALEYLTTRLSHKDTKIVDSPRSSVHVHINVQKMTMRQVLSYVLLYYIFEEALVDWCGTDRVGNLFCLRAKDSAYIMDRLVNAFRQDKFGNLTEDEHRYASCNLAALSKYGSVEFRALKGTVDAKIIMIWVDALLRLREKSKEFEDPTQIILKFEQLGPIGFKTWVFGENNILNSYSNSYITKSIWDGIRRVKDVAFCTTWCDALSQLKEKKSKETLSGRATDYRVFDDPSIQSFAAQTLRPSTLRARLSND